MVASGINSNLSFAIFAGSFLLCLFGALWFDSYSVLAIPFALLLFLAGWQHVNLIFFLLIASLPFSIEWQVTASLGTDFPDELLMIATAGLFLFYWLYYPRAIDRMSISHPLIVLLVITFIWSALTAFFSTHPLISLKYLLAKCWYIGAFILAPIIVFRTPKNLRLAMIILGSSMTLVVLLTMYRHSAYDFSFSGINPSLKPFFRNHVNYSAMLVCLVPIVFAFYWHATNKALKFFLAGVILMLLAALLFSYARGAWLALLTGGIAYWLTRKRILVGTYVVAMLILLGSVVWLRSGDKYLSYAHDYRTTIFHQDFREHLRATYEFKDVSTAERFYRWIAGVRMIKENPLTGFGPATFYNNYKPYAVPAFKTWVSNNPEHSTVHNYFLLVIIEQGIPGLVFFLLLAGVMLYYAQRVYHRSKDLFYRSVAITTGVVAVMILTLNFLSDLMETDKVGSLFLLCLSILVIADINSRRSLDAPADV
ncbi:MAG: O-antigen ligase family protein [Chitinophagaceae bacterium]|nr:O-antigen ligase family protein [Chitinophagaceae bacterium]